MGDLRRVIEEFNKEKECLEEGKVRGTPDGTGPYGRGLGPSKGKKKCPVTGKKRKKFVIRKK